MDRLYENNGYLNNHRRTQSDNYIQEWIVNLSNISGAFCFDTVDTIVAINSFLEYGSKFNQLPCATSLSVLPLIRLKPTLIYDLFCIWLNAHLSSHWQASHGLFSPATAAWFDSSIHQGIIWSKYITRHYDHGKGTKSNSARLEISSSLHSLLVPTA